MKNFTSINDSSKIPRVPGNLAAVWHWLIEPSPSVVEPERRLQARMLMAMLLVLLILGLLSVILTLFDVYTSPGESKAIASIFIWTTVASVLLLTIEYGLSRTRHYPLAAVLTVATVLSATFMAVIVNPHDLRSLSFLILGGLIGSLFLSARITVVVFFVTFIGLLILPVFARGFSILNIIDALFFILTVGALVVMAASLRQRYLEQIDRQTHQLIESRSADRVVQSALPGRFAGTRNDPDCAQRISDRYHHGRYRPFQAI